MLALDLSRLSADWRPSCANMTKDAGFSSQVRLDTMLLRTMATNWDQVARGASESDRV